MNLESARELKMRLTAENLWASVPRPGARTPLGLTGGALGAVGGPALPGATGGGLVTAFRATRPPQIPLTIGISGRSGSHKLAVRVQQAVPGIETVLDRVRRQARGEIEVRTTGRVFKQASWRARRNRPLRIGSSIGHVSITAGTLGCFVTAAGGDGQEDLVLSNNHVLANENLADRGDAILQPGPGDGGHRRRDRIGSLAKFVRLKRRHNLVDAAVAEIDEGTEYYYNYLERLGPIRGVRNTPPQFGETVYKLGLTTGLTKGRISAVEMDDLRVGYDMGDVLFDGQLEIAPAGNKPFSLGGDSGSLIVDSRRRALGLLFAGNDVDATYANPIGDVLRILKMSLVY